MIDTIKRFFGFDVEADKLKSARRTKISEVFPLYSVEGNLMFSKSQSISCCIELKMPESYSLSHTEMKGMYNLFNRIMKAIPYDYVIHKQDYYIEKHYPIDKEANTFLAKSFEKNFNERFFLDHRSYLFISKAPIPHAPPNYMTSFITNRVINRDNSDSIVEFINTQNKVIHILESMNIDCQLLEDVAIADLCNEYLNLGDRQVLKPLSIEKDYIQVGSDTLAMYSSCGYEIELAKEADSNVNVSEYFDNSYTFQYGIGLSKPHIINTIIRKPNSNTLIKLLSSKREKIYSMSLKSRENEQLVIEYDDFLSNIIKTGEIPVLLSQNILTWGNGEKLNKAENEINNALAKLDIYTQREFNCGNLFFNSAPGCSADISLSAYQIQLSDVASMFFPIETNPKDTGVNGLKLCERTYGIPIILDFWEYPMEKGWITNRNMFILGPSGSGKSFFTNHMVRQLIEQNYHVTIIDVGGSYERLCHHKKGKYFEYTANTKMAFNPFYTPIVNGKVIIRNLEELESLKTLIFTLWKGESGEPSKEEYTILSKGLGAYFDEIKTHNEQVLELRKATFPHLNDVEIAHQLEERKKAEQDIEAFLLKTSNFNAFYEFVENQFIDLFSEKDLKYFELDSFKMVLGQYYEGGEFDYLLNSEQEFSIADLSFCVFELDEVKDHPVIFPVIALVIMDAFISKMRKHKGVRKIILIEEAWSAMSNNGMARFLRYLYKTVRKFAGSVGIITQEIEDIVNNELVKNTIINNADIQILLDQTKYQNRFGEIQRALGISDSEKKKILSINKIIRPNEKYKEVYIRFGNVGKVYAVLVSPQEAAMYTTEAADSLKINALVKSNMGDITYAIQRFIELKQTLKTG